MKFFNRMGSKGNKVWLLIKNPFSEISYIVIGVLIALYFQDFYGHYLEQRHLSKVNQHVVSGIENDIADMERNLHRYSQIEPLFVRVQERSATPDLLEKRLTQILIETDYTVFSHSGVEQLKALAVKDSLSFAVIEVYDEMQNHAITPFEETILKESMALKNHFRDNYSWYPEWVRYSPSEDKSSKELQDYFLRSAEYRHFVISRYQIIYENYLPSLKYYIKKLKYLREKLQDTHLSDSAHNIQPSC